MQVLVVEEYTSLCELIVRFLDREEDINAIGACKIKTAGQMFNEAPGEFPIVVICGSLLFTSEGLEFTRKVRQEGGKIILISSLCPPKGFDLRYFVEKDGEGTFFSNLVAKIRELS